MQLGTSRRLIGRILAREVLDRDDAFLRSQVREQRRRHHVADRVHALLAGLLKLVDLNEAAIDFDLCAFKAETGGVRHAPHGDQQHLGFQLNFLAFFIFACDHNAAVGLLKFFEFGAELAI